MIEFNMNEAEIDFSKIYKLLKDGKEEIVIISRNGNPVLKVTLYEDSDKNGLIGCASGSFDIPEDFDDIDLENDFEKEIFPQ